jgi:uroporphyrinogen-III synthase
MRIAHCPVYAAGALPLSPDAAAALRAGAVALLHSPRAAAYLSSLVDEAGIARAGTALAAISRAAAEAAGDGWRKLGIAASPRDQALLECAAKLCKTAAGR